MRLLNVIQCTNLGGMEMATILMLEGLKARGHEIELLSLNPLGALRQRLEEAGIPARGIHYCGRGGWRSFPEMLRTMRRRKYDSLLLTGHNFCASAAIATIPAKRKVMAIHFHHFEAGAGSGHWKWIYGLAENVFDTVTFCTDFIRDEALSIRPSLARKSLMVPNPFIIAEVPSRAERAAARAALGLDPSAVLVGNAGWLIERKRFDVFLDVAAAVLRAAPATLFAVAGDGPHRGYIEAHAHRLGIARNVVFLGLQPDLGTFYKAIDILLFNSDFDALGRTPAEAAGFGVPVVASVVRGGLKELFRSDEEAIVLDTHDVQRLASLVLEFARDDARRRKLGAAGRVRVADYGDLARHVDEYEHLLC